MAGVKNFRGTQLLWQRGHMNTYINRSDITVVDYNCGS